MVGYLGQYIHSIGISNHRIIDVNDREVCFMSTAKLTGEEFLRRLRQHILPSGFVKIRYYGIYSARFRTTILNEKEKMVITPVETIIERIDRLTGIDVLKCPFCKKGRLVPIAIIPSIHSPPQVVV